MIVLINLSKPIKKRKVSNEIFLLIFIPYVIILNVYEHIFTNIPVYFTVILGIIGFVMLIDGIDRYLDYIRMKWQKNHHYN